MSKNQSRMENKKGNLFLQMYKNTLTDNDLKNLFLPLISYEQYVIYH